MVKPLQRYLATSFFSFTRSVAEQSNFPKSENHSTLFGYNALEDTGKEWYAQPVDEVIYQEFSNGEAVASDYFTSNLPEVRITSASSTDDIGQTQKLAKVNFHTETVILFLLKYLIFKINKIN